MRLLAIDPGTEKSGFVLYDSQAGTILESGVDDNPHMLYDIPRTAASIVAIEMIASYGMPVGREVFETCVWIGRFQQAWREPEQVRRVLRREVKMHLCASAKAKDANIWQALVDRFGPPGTKAEPGTLYGVKSHARAALALAVTVADQLSVAP